MMTKVLNIGVQMPVLGLGTWKAKREKVGKAVESAILDSGYRHIDCALIYKNEKEIGRSLKRVFNKEVKREEVFITGKLWNTDHAPLKVEKGIRKTLKDLGLKYVDLYLMHWGLSEPRGVTILETWKAMENLVSKGLVRAIGVANFTVMMLEDLIAGAEIKPAVNQVELHPYNTQEGLVEYCLKERIVVTAYSPLGTPQVAGKDAPKIMEDPVIKKLAKKYQKTEAQILIRWAIQRGTTVIPKSINESRISENSQVFDFEIPESNMKKISELNRNYRFIDPSQWWWKMAYFD